MKLIKKVFLLIIAIMIVFGSSIIQPTKSNALEIITTNIPLENLRLQRFLLKRENMEILSQRNDVIKQEQVELPGRKPSTIFFVKPDKSHGFPYWNGFDNALKLKFNKAGKYEGKDVDVIIDITKVAINPVKHKGVFTGNFKDANAIYQPFLTVDDNFGEGVIWSQDYIHPPTTLKNFIHHDFTVESYIKAEYKWHDQPNEPCNLKMVMLPSDIDVVDEDSGTREIFWIQHIAQKIDKIIKYYGSENDKFDLDEYDENDGWHSYRARGPESNVLHNMASITGFGFRSLSNSINFAYRTTGSCGIGLSFYIENPQGAITKSVNPNDMRAEEGKEIEYTVDVKGPEVGKDLICKPKTFKVVDTFDSRLKFPDNISSAVDVYKKNAQGKYEKINVNNISVSKSTKITIDLSNYISSSYEFRIKYKAKTKGVKTTNGVKGDGRTIYNRAHLVVDDVWIPSNEVKTGLWYAQTHEFRSATSGKNLPKEVTDLTPEKIEKLRTGTTAHPTKNFKTKVDVSDGYWEFTKYDQDSKKIDGDDVHFIGYWVFKPYIEFIKIDENGKPLTDVVFNLNKDGQVFIPEIRTDSKVKIKIEGLEEGKYELWEKISKPGYIKPNKAVATFTVGNDAKISNIWTNNDNDTSKIKNIPNEIEFLKTDDAGKILSGVIFELRREGSIVSGYENIKSNNEGKITITKLRTGNYELWEKTPLPGYKNPGKVASFTVGQDSNIINIKTNSDDNKKITNTPYVPMEFYINKIMSDTKSSIKVGILKVNLKGTGQNSSYSQDFKFDLNKDYTTYDTTKTGLKIPISNDVKTGDYELREIEAPAGFAKTDKVFKIRINQENRTIELLNESNDIERELFSENSINGTIEFGNPIDIENAHGEFPKTGGVGELPFIFTGLGMLAIAKKGIKKK